MVELPKEILLYIVQFLPSPSDFFGDIDCDNYKDAQNTLVDVCLASKTLCAFAQPILHQAYFKDQENDYWLIEKTSKEFRPPTRLQLFLRTLIQRPDLAARVEALQLEDFRDDLSYYEDRDGTMRKTDPAFIKLFAKASRDLSLATGSRQHSSWRKKWQNVLRRSADNAEVTLLLMLVPNLKVLDLRASGEDFGFCFHQLCQEISNRDHRTDEERRFSMENRIESLSEAPLPALSRLQTLICRSDEDARVRLSFPKIQSLVSIPTLQTIALHGDFDDFEDDSGWQLPMTNIRELHLRKCSLLSTFIRSFIQSCENLKVLRIRYPYYSEELDLGEDFLDCLSQRSSTLQELKLVVPSNGIQAEFLFADPFDLRRLTSLHSLEINMDILFNTEEKTTSDPSFEALLPQSLRHLSIRHCDAGFRNHIAVFKQEYKIFPDLETVEICIREKDGLYAADQGEMAWKLALEDCAREVREAGLEFEVPIEGTEYSMAYGEDDSE